MTARNAIVVGGRLGGAPLPLGAYAKSARQMAACGLAVLPLGGDDGKVPLVSGWGKWKRRPGSEFIDKLAEKNPTANIGIVCGLSGVTVLDIDDPAATDELIAKCGDTPLKVQTPSGGRHLYYRYNGERCANLRPHDFEADVKAQGGIVTAPPSMRPDTGRLYEFIEGDWSDLDRLPVFKPLMALATVDPSLRQLPISDSAHPARIGQRNNTLFRTVLRESRNCATMDDVLMLARKVNEGFSPPLNDYEAAKTALSAWMKHQQGRNWIGREAHISLPISLWCSLSERSDALVLFGHLLAAHGARLKPFAVSPKGMVAADVIRGWERRRYERNRDWLLEARFLTCLHKGGSKPGDPSLFTFGTAYSKGDNSCPQYNLNTPTPQPLPLVKEEK